MLQVYEHARPRGLAPWRPQQKTRALLVLVNDVLEEYAEHLPITLRQLFYRLVGKHSYSKTERAYGRLCEMMVRARRAGLIPFQAIRDDGASESRFPFFYGLTDFWAAVREAAETYRIDRQDGQQVFLEVWVEAAGMAPQMERVAHPYGIPVFSSGGFDSVTVKHEASQRMLRRDVPTVVLHVGDLDPSGVSIFDAAAEDVEAFVAHLTILGQREDVHLPRFRRAAVTRAQVERYGLPEAPPKRTDKRGDWTGGTVQAEALAPPDLAADIGEAIRSHLDLGVYNEVLDREAKEREDLLAGLGTMLPSQPEV